MSEPPAEVTSPAPLLGQHSEEVLRKVLDMAQDEVAALKNENAIG